MNIVFLGSGGFARELLGSVMKSGLRPRAVISGEDRPAGRGLRKRPTPVASLAETGGLEVHKLGGPRDRALREVISRPGLQAVLVADYGHLIPGDVLRILPQRFLNVHPSLLPRYRGAAPIRRALLEGAETTGVSLMVMEEGLDTGPVIAREETPVLPDEDALALRNRLALLGASLVVDRLPLYLDGELAAEPQDESSATYAAPLRKEDLRIDWTLPAVSVHNQVRALAPDLGAWTCWRGKRIKVFRTRLLPEARGLRAGELRSIDARRLVIGTGEGDLELLVVQPEGRKKMTAAEFLRGYRPESGETFSMDEKGALDFRARKGG